MQVTCQLFQRSANLTQCRVMENNISMIYAWTANARFKIGSKCGKRKKEVTSKSPKPGGLLCSKGRRVMEFADEKTIDRICVVCAYNLIERSHIPYRPAVSRDIIGPGSRNTATEADRVVDGYHCSNCGVAYQKLPKIQ